MQFSREVTRHLRSKVAVIGLGGLGHMALKLANAMGASVTLFTRSTRKGEPETGSVISQKSLAALITKIIDLPDKYSRENLGVNKPNS
jgi:phosphoglycerate dehydrogenase-like enzyme